MQYCRHHTQNQEVFQLCSTSHTHTASCNDGDLKLVGGASETEGRLEVCFNKRWGTINADGWTRTDTQVACKQLGFSTLSNMTCSYYHIYPFQTLLCSFYAEVFYSEKTRFLTQSLPVHITSVGCNSSSQTLLDCDYHEFPNSTTISIDISISCGGSDG